MSQADTKLTAIASQLKKGVAPQQETVRSFLLWFNSARRGYRVVRSARQALRKHGLMTTPDFEAVYIDSPISFVKLTKDSTSPDATPDDIAPDPTYRVGRLPSAHVKPVSVKPDDSLQQAVTLMMSRDFSQLPVMTGPRDVKGMVSWKSIGSRLALKQPCALVRDCMEEARLLRLDEPLFAAISLIAAHDYVLIQAIDKSICGIVTATDVNEQFRLLAEPFLLVGEIENGIRRLLHGRFTAKDLEAAKAPGDEARVIATPADLSFGEYVRLIERDSHWKKLKLEIDRAAFVAQLNRVRDIRNDVMHFDPDGLEDDDLRALREFAQFLKRLREVGAV